MNFQNARGQRQAWKLLHLQATMPKVSIANNDPRLSSAPDDDRLALISPEVVNLVRLVTVEKAEAIFAEDAAALLATALTDADIANIVGLPITEVEFLRAEFDQLGEAATGDWLRDQSVPTITGRWEG
ncbi:hypothetical protein [Paracoccus everestensis]|uniref:hypothetical protein n=1 Tax=Paracoccus everestensis TaxID=2903900 RepID=UPI001F1C6EB6|nr:hypothetical protein [Paracoccus everestensis]